MTDWAAAVDDEGAVTLALALTLTLTLSPNPNPNSNPKPYQVKLLQKQLPAELTVCQDALVRAESAERTSRAHWSVMIEQEMRKIEADGQRLLQVSHKP